MDMSGFIGVLQLDGSPIDDVTMAGVRTILRRRGSDEPRIARPGELALACWPHAIPDPAPGPESAADDAVRLALVGSIVNTGESVTRLYQKLGPDFVGLVDGQFSLVIWDPSSRSLFGARDRFGLKPFYYHISGNRLVCASEIKAILEVPGIRRAPDYEGLADQIFCGAPLADRTLFAGIRQLRPGYALSVQGGRVHTAPYWDLEYRYRYGRSDADVAAELTELLADAIRIRCGEGLRVGSHLSGGLDSSVIAGCAAKSVSPLKTLSIRFAEGAMYDETYYAKLVAAHVGTEYHEATPTADDLAFYWPALVWHLEAPLPNASGFSYFMVSRLAAEHVDIVLTGHGGDEVFGGYPAQFVVGLGSTSGFASTQAPSVATTSLATRLRRRLRLAGVRGLVDKLRPRGRQGGIVGAEAEWVRLHCGLPASRNPILGKRLRGILGDYAPLDDYLDTFRTAATEHLFDRCLHHDLRCYLPGLLRQSERVSNATALESRVPLLDRRIVEFMATVPPEQKVRGFVPKYMLRMVGSWLPDEVRERKDKLGFPTPIPKWLAKDLVPWTRAVLHSTECLDRGVIDPDEIRRGTLNPGEVWKAVNLELWHRIFIDQDPAWCAQTDRISSGRFASAR